MLGLLIEGTVYALLLFAPLAFGAVELWATGVVQILATIAFAAWAWGAWGEKAGGGDIGSSGASNASRTRDSVLRPHALLWLLIGGFVALCAAQLLPLPRGVLAALAPGSHRLYEATIPGYAEGKEVPASGLSDWLIRRGEASLPDAARAGAAPGIENPIDSTAAWSFAPSRSLSIAPHHTRLALSALLSYAALLAVILGHFRDRERRARLFAVAIFSGFLVSLLGIVQKLSWNGRLYWVREGVFPDPFGPFVNRNSFAAFAGAIFPLALCLALSSLSRAAAGDKEEMPRLFFHAFAAATMLGGIFYSLSRGGMLAAGVSILLAAILLWRLGKRPQEVALIGALLMVAAVLLLWIGPEQVVERVETLGEGGRTPSLTLRFHAWGRSLDLIKDHLWLGTGLGTFRFAFLRYSPPGQAWWTTAHNEYLELLCDTGLAGALLALAGLGVYFISVWRPHSFREKSSRYAYSGLIAGVAGLLLHSMISSNLQVPANGIILVVLGGSLLSMAEGRPESAAGRRRIGRSETGRTEEARAEEGSPVSGALERGSR